jgi:hypothetical protein
VLEVTYIGYQTQQVKVTGNALTVTLTEDNRQLNEVVVVGYGTMRKKDLTGSVVQSTPQDCRPKPGSVQICCAARRPANRL